VRECQATTEGAYDEQCPAKLAGVVSVVKRTGPGDNKHWALGAFVWIEQGKHGLCANRLAGLKDPGLEKHEIVSKNLVEKAR
jgi:hypothetical protein